MFCFFFFFFCHFLHTLFLAKQIVNIPMYEKHFLRWREKNSLTPRCLLFNLENGARKNNTSGDFLSNDELSTLVHSTEKLIAVVENKRESTEPI
uniref:Putative secreted protein n=1 Tax=Rhipicephalus microplus TaxID=6941 RepID=A0A6M2DDD3_RHIMP